MTNTEYRKTIAALGMNQKETAEFLGISYRSSQGYALGEYPIPGAIAKLLRIMIKLKIKPADIS